MLTAAWISNSERNYIAISNVAALFFSVETQIPFARQVKRPDEDWEKNQNQPVGEVCWAFSRAKVGIFAHQILWILDSFSRICESNSATKPVKTEDLRLWTIWGRVNFYVRTSLQPQLMFSLCTTPCIKVNLQVTNLKTLHLTFQLEEHWWCNILQPPEL